MAILVRKEKNGIAGILAYEHSLAMGAVLCRELISVSDWRSLGLNLGVRDYELNEIERSHPTEGCGRWRQETISLWLRRTPSASWETVVKALQKTRENTLAVRIHRKYIGGTACKSQDACC